MKPKGFWSYARGDDDHLDKMLSELRKQVAGEVSMLMGHDVGIFQDIHDLRTGDRWAETLRAGVTNASFLIPVLTPRFFNRPWCCEEVLTYLEIAKEKDVEPHIFPIKLVDWDDDADCEVRKALQPFQFKDFSNWRFESDPTAKNRLLNTFGKDVKARLNIKPTPQKTTQKTKITPSEMMPTEATRPEPSDAKRSKPQPPKTYTVDPFTGRGDFQTISAAIDAAEAGSRIIIREGTYRESIHLSKALELIGEGDRERILVVTNKGNALSCDASMARISGMRFRREADEKFFGAEITTGAVEIEDCIFESLSLSVVAIHGAGTTPTLRRCLLRDGEQNGVFVFDGARPTLEDCQFVNNSLSGVEVKGEQSFPTLRNCISENGRQSGFHFCDDAGGLMEHCQAVANVYAGVQVREGANPLIKGCVIRGNKHSGIFVFEQGRGRFRDCLVENNGSAGFEVSEGGMPDVSRCDVSDNKYYAIQVRDDASGGTFTDNDLTGNGRGAWDIAEGAKVTKSGNKE